MRFGENRESWLNGNTDDYVLNYSLFWLLVGLCNNSRGTQIWKMVQKGNQDCKNLGTYDSCVSSFSHCLIST